CHAYAEGRPSCVSVSPFAGRYAMKHSPFLYFRSVRSRLRLRNHVVPYSRFPVDLAGGRLPPFSLVVRTLCHSMHDCSVATGDRWLAGFVAPLLASPELDDYAVVVTFGEGTSWVHQRG